MGSVVQQPSSGCELVAKVFMSGSRVDMYGIVGKPENVFQPAGQN